MKVVCAWCGRDLGKKDGEGVKGVSHGVCEKCLAEQETKAKNGNKLREHIAARNTKPRPNHPYLPHPPKL